MANANKICIFNSKWNSLLRDIFNIVRVHFVIIAGSRKAHRNDVRQNIWAITLIKEDNVENFACNEVNEWTANLLMPFVLLQLWIH